TSDQCGSEVTDNFHTSVPSTGGVGIPLSLEFSPYPSPEPGLVKDPSGGVVPGVVPPLVHVPLVPLIGMDPDLGRVVRPNGPALELLEEVLRRRLGVLLSGRHLREHGQPLLRRSLQERFPVQRLAVLTKMAAGEK